MARTLILMFHPDSAGSRANRALATAARGVAGVDLVDVYAAYPEGGIDVAAEVARLCEADRIVLQFPIQWYSTPPLLKAWQDAVLTRMFYVAPEEGRRLDGRPFMVATTAGNTSDAYAPDGVNLFKIAELLAPLRATAHRCGLRWTPPFVVYDARTEDAGALDAAAARYADRLRHWPASPEPGRSRRPSVLQRLRRGLAPRRTVSE